MTNDMKERTSRTFAERLREAVNDHPAATARNGRHKLRRLTRPLSSPLANPSRVTRDELFIERLRKAMD